MQRKWFSILSLVVVLTLMAPATGAQVPTPQAQGSSPALDAAQPAQPTTAQAHEPSPAPDLPQPAGPNPLLEAVRRGAFPAQLAGHSGAIRPDRHGPQRNDLAQGIPAHAYSPFDERRNREYPCPPGGCDFAAGQVVIKLAPSTGVRDPNRAGAWTASPSLNETLSAQGVLRLEPVFPNARRPRLGETVVSPTGERLPKPDLTRWYRAVLPETADVYAVVESLSADPNVAYAEPDYLRKPVGTPSRFTPHVQRSPAQIPGPGTDPLYAHQWHLNAVNAPQAWQWLEDNGYAPGGSRDIVVAVIDTGMDYTHPDLAANMWINAAEFSGSPGVDDDGNGYVDDIYGADTVYPDGDPQDDHGHGTHVAGIIAAQANNAEGGVGVAYNVQMMALKAAQYSGVLASSDIAEAIYYAVEKGADVINMSFGGYARSQVEEDALAVAFGQAVLVAAAGNDGFHNEWPCMWPIPPKPMYPAAHNWVLGIMASTQGDSRAVFSNYDCVSHSSREYELMAPGVDVWSALPNEIYAAWDGTSMAAPIVSGIAALARTKWSDKDIYSSRFIMGQIAANADPVADAYTALTVAPEPELSYLEHWLFDTEAQSPDNDDDGIVDAGETVDLAIVIRNHWGKADPVTVTLEAWAEGAVFPDPYVTMITDTVSYGAIGSFNQDDNGLIYDDEGVITGVRHPFRFTVPITTPNDHVIPFLLTMTAGNGYDPDDSNAPYVFQSRFYLIVQRGTELPIIISEDMILTKDYYWIVLDQTLIEPSVTVTVTEGTQVQFGAPTPSDPYGEDLDPFLQVEGDLQILGTFEEPVELFGSEQLTSRRVQIRNLGTAVLSYVRVVNPTLGSGYSHIFPYSPMTSISHLFATTDRFMSDGIDRWSISSLQLTKSILHKLQGGMCQSPQLGLNGPMEVNTVLVDALVPEPQCGYGRYTLLMGKSCAGIGGPISNTVFLQNNTDDRPIRWWQWNYPDAILLYRNNAFLSKLWDPNSDHWMQIEVSYATSRDDTFSFAHNYWGTTSTALIDAMVYDYNDDFNIGRIEYQPILTTPVTTTYPFVVDVTLSTASDPDATIVGAETVTFTVTFNRDVTTTIQPAVSFGPDVPETDYTVHPVDGGWQDSRTWAGTFNITPITGDGYQLMRIAGAVAADDPWLVTGDDTERFRFEIITSGTEAMNLQATGGEGYVDLMWTQDDFDLLAGFNLYRATTQDGTYTRINTSILPPDQRTYQDTNVQPGQPYYYKFTVVKSDMTESDFSNVATATPIDTIPPVISHTPVTEAPPGLPLTLFADVTDNVGVQGVTLYYRAIGETDYISKTMVNTTGDRYSATIEGSQVNSPGLEYYIEANDGVSTVREGRADYPYQVTVEDRPVVTVVSPDHGPTDGGTLVTISGSNFKAGATVTFGGAAAENVTVLSSSQITCTTPPHFPETVDVTVTNPDSQSGTLLRGFTYESDVVSLSLPDTGGEQHAIVQVPINAADVQGLAAADLTVTFDAGVLSGQGASTGNLTPGWSLVANTTTPGQIVLAMASSGGTVSGSGVLAYLEFEVVGSPATTSTLHFASVSLNDGAIPVETTDGSFAVSLVYDVSGTVRFWQDSAGVPGVLLTLEGDRIYSGLSQADGAYTVSGASAGDYTLTPGKSDDVNGISAYDASLVLQHAAGLITLSGHQATAADVNKSEAITSMDAFYILQKTVELITLPFPGAGVVWDFDPANRIYTNLNSDQTGQDFTAVLLGDVSGNWSAMGGLRVQGQVGRPMAGVQDVTATLSLPQVAVLPGERVTVPLTLALPQGQVYGADVILTYDPAVVSATEVVKGALATGWSMASNTTNPGVVRVALAGATPIVTSGELLLFVFEAVGSAGSETDLTLTRGELNEGDIPTDLQHGHLNIATPVQAAFTASPTSGVASLTVVFTNTSTGDYTASLWDFGDGITDTQTSPTHTYTAASVYSVTLTVSGPGGTDTLTRTNYITAHVCDIAGSVHFWQDAVGVPGVLLTLEGDTVYTGTSDAMGAYTVTNVLGGDYTLTPTKTNGVNGISAYDASFALRRSAGIITLTVHQATAADVNKSGAISSMDASLILQKAVDLITLPFPGAGVVWDFDPASRSYTDLSGDQTGQDFTAMLLGDVSGNWSAMGGQGLSGLANGPVIVRVQGGVPDATGTVTATVLLDPAGAQVYSLDLALAYDTDAATALAVELGPVAEGWMMAANLNRSGEAVVSLAGALPITEAGPILTLRFHLPDPAQSTSLQPTRGEVNEGAVPTQLIGGQLGASRLYLPLILSSAGGQGMGSPAHSNIPCLCTLSPARLPRRW